MADDQVEAYADDAVADAAAYADDQFDQAYADNADAADDDFHSLGNATDDIWRFRDNYENYYDDDRYYSTKKTTSWLDKLLSNTTAEDVSLTPVEDVNPDNVLATLIFNAIVCLILLGLYELLRRWIPSVYSQRLVHEQRGYNKRRRERGEGANEEGIEAGLEAKFARVTGMKASGKSLWQLRGEQSVMQDTSAENENEDGEGGADRAGGVGDGDNSFCQANLDLEPPCPERLPPHCTDFQQESHTFTCFQRDFAFPVLEWCIPVHATPWSTFRKLAGLDAYFYLRYIRMCLKITAVSSFWAIIILCPVYATGGGDQSGFYHFSMANVTQDDRGRVWVPTIFCWAFTLYCFFCVRTEMIHFVELRMEFLGGEEEEKIMQQTRSSTGYGAPSDKGSVNDENGNALEQSEIEERRSRSRSPLLPGEEGVLTPIRTSSIQHGQLTTPRKLIQQQMKQHRYSLQVEKVPVALRSNTALFSYFNDLFPGQVHSACVAMNVPDLDALSARRMRVCRRLEKSLAYLNVTGIRPTHIAGRPRCQCCGIESTPIDGLCIAFSCCYDSCQTRQYLDIEDEDYPTEYTTLPEKGECVDSILYYTCDLAITNLQMKRLQEMKFMIAETGHSPRAGGGMGVNGIVESNCDWYAQPLATLKTTAAKVSEGLREEFEVSGEEDYLGDGVTVSYNYGSTASNGGLAAFSPSKKQRSPEKRTRLVDEDHLTELDGDSAVPIDGDDFSEAASSRRQGRRYRSRVYTWFRAILWRMGVDFLAAGLDEVRRKTDTVVDSVTRPSMSSTGFVTFKTLTPVTVTTSAPLTYNRNPMEVSVAPEPRDIVWENVQIDRDIGASRAFVADVLLGLGVLLWSIPLTLIQAWAKVEYVALIPGMEWVDKIHGGAWKPLINAYLPVVALLGLILLLPLIFQLVATSYEKRKTLSGVQNSIVGRYFYYQLANIYITVTAGALWTSLAEIIDHPQSLLVILGETLPKLAGYFISLLITKTLAGLPMVLLRIGALSRMMFLRSCFNKKRLTQRELKEVYRKQPIYYGWEYPTQFLVIIICFTYACITPFVLPVGAVYYFVALLVYKKQALYVYTPTYQSGGRLFPQAVNKTLFALLISQLTFIGYSLIRKAIFQIILLAPLPFLTVFFTLFVQDRYVEPSKKLSLERAVKIDAQGVDPAPEFSDEAYQQPCLSEKASVPVPEGNPEAVYREVVANLERLQNEGEGAQSSGIV